MNTIKEHIQIKPNSRVLLCVANNGKPKYHYLGKLYPAKKSFFTFRSVSSNNQKISLPFLLVKKLSDQGFSILIKIPGKLYNIAASNFLLKAQLDNQTTNREIRMSLTLSEFSTGNNKNNLFNKLKFAENYE